MMNCFFIIFFICYFLRSLYLWFLGDFRYTRAFHTMFMRYLIKDIFQTVFDVVPIVAILIVHIKEFRKPERQPFAP